MTLFRVQLILPDQFRELVAREDGRQLIDERFAGIHLRPLLLLAVALLVDTPPAVVVRVEAIVREETVDLDAEAADLLLRKRV